MTRTNTLPNGQTHQEDVELITEFSWRNFFSTINFAKIMQKLSKNRSHRIWMLVQYKSSVSMGVHYRRPAELIFMDTGCVKACSSRFASNAAATRSQTHQKSSAILWAKMATMCGTFFAANFCPYPISSEYESHHFYLPELQTGSSGRMADWH